MFTELDLLRGPCTLPGCSNTLSVRSQESGGAVAEHLGLVTAEAGQESGGAVAEHLGLVTADAGHEGEQGS